MVGGVRLEKKILIIAAGCLAAVLCIAFPFVLFGADYLHNNYGPANVWFRAWEGDVSFPDSQQPFELVLKPAQANPGVVVIRVASSDRTKAVFRTPSGALLRRPEDANQLRVFDWYNGDLTLEYVPVDVRETGDVRIQWKFGYE